MSNIEYLSFPVEVDADVLAANALDYLMAYYPGWVPRDSQLEVVLIEIISRMMSETANVAAQVPLGIFRFLGKSLYGIPSINARSATMTSTWNVTDTLGHTIPAGTYVFYRVDGDTNIAFKVQNDVMIAPGNTSTVDDEVILEAVVPGTSANGLDPAELYLVDALAWVAPGGITSTSSSAGGVDAESDTDYLNRLRSELQLLTKRPIKPNDFALLALDIGGVGRAVSIDNYNPANNTYNNERMVTVAVAGADGTAVGSGIKDEVKAYLESLREINFIVNVIGPSYTTVNVTATVKKFAGQDSSVVEAACESALSTYLSPANWDWSGTVYYYELIALLSNVTGVDRVMSLSTPNGDLALGGVAALPTSGAINVTVTG